MTVVISDYAERVLSIVESIPAGRVLSYGDIAEMLGTGGPRQVGTVMSRYGGAVAWWRVVRADGVLLRGKQSVVLEQYQREGTAMKQTVSNDHEPRIDMAIARWSSH